MINYSTNKLPFKKGFVVLAVIFSIMLTYLVAIPDFMAFAEGRGTEIDTSQKAPAVDSSLGQGNKLTTDDASKIKVIDNNQVNSALVRVSIFNATNDLEVSANKAPILQLKKNVSASTTVLLPVEKGNVNIYADHQTDVRIEVISTFISSPSVPGSLIALDAFQRVDTNKGLGGRSLEDGSLSLGVTGLGGVPTTDVRAVFWTAKFNLGISGVINVGSQKFHLNSGETTVSSLSVPDLQGAIKMQFTPDNKTNAGISTVQLWTRGYVSGSKMGDYSANSGGSFIPRVEDIKLPNDGELKEGSQASFDLNSSKDSEISLGLITGENLGSDLSTVSIGDDNSREQGSVNDPQIGIIPQLVAIHPDKQHQGNALIHNGSAKIQLVNVGDILQNKVPSSLPQAPEVTITSPQNNEEFNFAKHARVRIEGEVATRDIALSRIEVSFSGDADSGRTYAETVIGNAKTSYQENGNITWQIDTAPEESGNYTYFVKAYDRSGAMKTETLKMHITMPTTEDIANADARVIGSNHNTDQGTPGAGVSNKILDVSKDWVLFDKPDNLFIGMVIVSDRIPGLAPDGLIRIITAIDQTNQGWRATTEPGGLADALIKADYKKRDNLVDYVSQKDLDNYNDEIAKTPGICAAETGIENQLLKDGRKSADEALQNQDVSTYSQQYDAQGHLVNTKKDGVDVPNGTGQSEGVSLSSEDTDNHGQNPDAVAEQNPNDIPEITDENITPGDCSKLSPQQKDMLLSGSESILKSPQGFRPLEASNLLKSKQIKPKPLNEECAVDDDMCNPQDSMPEFESDKAIVTHFCVTTDLGGNAKSTPQSSTPGRYIQIEGGFTICQVHEKQVYSERWTKVDLDLRPDFWNMHPYYETGSIKTEIDRTTYNNNFWFTARLKLLVGKLGIMVADKDECSKYEPEASCQTHDKSAALRADDNIFNIFRLDGTFMIAFIPVVYSIGFEVLIRFEFDIQALIYWNQVEIKFEKSGKIQNSLTGTKDIKEAKTNKSHKWTKGVVIGKFSVRIMAILVLEIYGGLIKIETGLAFKITFQLGIVVKIPTGSKHAIAYGQFKIVFEILLLFILGVSLKRIGFPGSDLYWEGFIELYHNDLLDIYFGPPDPNRFAGSYSVTLHQKDNNLPVKNVAYALYDADNKLVPITKRDVLPEDMDIKFGEYGVHTEKINEEEEDYSGILAHWSSEEYDAYKKPIDGFYPYNLKTPISGTHGNDGVVSSPNLDVVRVYDKDTKKPEIVTYDDSLAETILQRGQQELEEGQASNLPLGSSYLLVPDETGHIDISYLHPGNYHLSPVALNTQDRYNVTLPQTINFKVADWWERSHKTVKDPDVQVVQSVPIDGEVVMQNKTTVRNITRGESDYQDETQFAPGDILEYHEQLNYPKQYCMKEPVSGVPTLISDLQPEYSDVCPQNMVTRRRNNMILSNLSINTKLSDGQIPVGTITYQNANSNKVNVTEFSGQNSKITFDRYVPGTQTEVIYRTKVSGDVVKVNASQTVDYQDLSSYHTTEESNALTNLTSRSYAKESEVKFKTVIKNTSPLKSAPGTIYEIKEKTTDRLICAIDEKQPELPYQELANASPKCDYQTDDNGFVVVDYLTSGDYYFVMKDTPKTDDFLLDTKTHYPFSISSEGSLILMNPAYIKIRYHVDMTQKFKIENRDKSVNTDSKPVVSGDILDVETQMNYPRSYEFNGEVKTENRFLYNPIYQTHLDTSRYELLGVDSVTYNDGLSNQDIISDDQNIKNFYELAQTHDLVKYHNGDVEPPNFYPNTDISNDQTSAAASQNQKFLSNFKDYSETIYDKGIEYKYNINGFAYNNEDKEVWHFWDPRLNWFNCAFEISGYKTQYNGVNIGENQSIINECGPRPPQAALTWSKTPENGEPIDWDTPVKSFLAPGSYQTIKYRVKVLETNKSNDSNFETDFNFVDDDEGLKVVSNTYNGTANIQTFEKYSAPKRFVDGICYRLFSAANNLEQKLSLISHQDGGISGAVPAIQGASYESGIICPKSVDWKIDYLPKGTYYLERVQTADNYLTRDDNIYFSIDGDKSPQISDELDYNPNFSTSLEIENIDRNTPVTPSDLISKKGDHLLYHYTIDYPTQTNSAIAYNVKINNLISQGLQVVPNSPNNKLVETLKTPENSNDLITTNFENYNQIPYLGRKYHDAKENPLGSNRYEIYPGSHFELTLEVQLNDDTVKNASFYLNHAYQNSGDSLEEQNIQIYQGSLVATVFAKYSNMEETVPGVGFEVHKVETDKAGAILSDDIVNVSDNPDQGQIYSELALNNLAISDNHGVVHLEYLEKGNYYLKQMSVPKNYILEKGQKYYFSIANYNDNEPETHALLSNIEIDYQPNFNLTLGINNLARGEKYYSDRTVTKKGDEVEVQLHLSYPDQENSATAHNVKLFDFPTSEDDLTEPKINENGKNLVDRKLINSEDCQKMFNGIEKMKPGESLSCYYKAKVNTEMVQILRAKVVEQNHNSFEDPSDDAYLFTYPHEAHGIVKFLTNEGDSQSVSRQKGERFVLRNAQTFEKVSLTNKSENIAEPFSPQANSDGEIMPDYDGEIDLYYLTNGNYYLEQLNTIPGWTYDYTNYKSWSLLDLDAESYLNADIGEYIQTPLEDAQTVLGKRVIDNNQVQVIQDILLPKSIANGSLTNSTIEFNGVNLEDVDNTIMVGLIREGHSDAILSYGIDYKVEGNKIILTDSTVKNLAGNDHLIIGWIAKDSRTVFAKFTLNDKEYLTNEIITDTKSSGEVQKGVTMNKVDDFAGVNGLLSSDSIDGLFYKVSKNRFAKHHYSTNLKLILSLYQLNGSPNISDSKEAQFVSNYYKKDTLQYRAIIWAYQKGLVGHFIVESKSVTDFNRNMSHSNMVKMMFKYLKLSKSL